MLMYMCKGVCVSGIICILMNYFNPCVRGRRTCNEKRLEDRIQDPPYQSGVSKHVIIIIIISSIFWVTTPCGPLKVNRRFGGTFRLYLQDRRISQARNQSEEGSKRGM
jgi:hypothetical protein